MTIAERPPGVPSPLEPAALTVEHDDEHRVKRAALVEPLDGPLFGMPLLGAVFRVNECSFFRMPSGARNARSVPASRRFLDALVRARHSGTVYLGTLSTLNRLQLELPLRLIGGHWPVWNLFLGIGAGPIVARSANG